MNNGKCEQEKGEAGTSSGGSAEALYPMYESGLYRNDVGYVKLLLLIFTLIEDWLKIFDHRITQMALFIGSKTKMRGPTGIWPSISMLKTYQQMPTRQPTFCSIFGRERANIITITHAGPQLTSFRRTHSCTSSSRPWTRSRWRPTR